MPGKVIILLNFWETQQHKCVLSIFSVDQISEKASWTQLPVQFIVTCIAILKGSPGLLGTDPSAWVPALTLTQASVLSLQMLQTVIRFKSKLQLASLSASLPRNSFFSGNICNGFCLISKPPESKLPSSTLGNVILKSELSLWNNSLLWFLKFSNLLFWHLPHSTHCELAPQSHEMLALLSECSAVHRADVGCHKDFSVVRRIRKIFHASRTHLYSFYPSEGVNMLSKITKFTDQGAA